MKIVSKINTEEECYEVSDYRKKLMRLVCTGEPEHLINYINQSHPDFPYLQTGERMKFPIKEDK